MSRSRCASRTTGEAGDWAAAREHLATLLPDEVRVLGPEYPLTLAARYDLARCTGEAGNAAGARDQLAALLPIQARVLGREIGGSVRVSSYQG